MKRNTIFLLRILVGAVITLLLLVCCLFFNQRNVTENARFIFVGTQNDADCTILFNQKHCFMIYTGEAQDAQHILDLLAEYQIEHIDTLVITHPDKDHIGGAFTLLKQIPVSELIVPYYNGDKVIYQQLVSLATDCHVPVTTLDFQQSFSSTFLGSLGGRPTYFLPEHSVSSPSGTSSR